MSAPKTHQRPPLLAGEIVVHVATGYPDLLLTAVEPITGMAWVSWKDNGEVNTGLFPVAELRPLTE